MKLTILVAVVLLFGLSTAFAQEAGDTLYNSITPQFDLPDSNFTSSGSLKLIWLIPDSILSLKEHIFELQQSEDPEFRDVMTRYKGSDLATYISGLRSGNFYYRVRLVDDDLTSDWSKPIVVTVEHHSLRLAFILFGIGAVVFLSTVAVVVHGVKKGEQ